MVLVCSPQLTTCGGLGWHLCGRLSVFFGMKILLQEENLCNPHKVVLSGRGLCPHSRERLAMSEDIFGFHSWRGRCPAEHRTVERQPPTTIHYLAPNVNKSKTEKALGLDYVRKRSMFFLPVTGGCCLWLLT